MTPPINMLDPPINKLDPQRLCTLDFNTSATSAPCVTPPLSLRHAVQLQYERKRCLERLAIAFQRQADSYA
jgi:hypothetical protein